VNSKILIQNAQIYTPSEILADGWLRIEEKRIAAFGTGIPSSSGDDLQVDAGGARLIPGMIDMHVHGAAGYDVMDGDAEHLTAIARVLAHYGVTSFLGATWTAGEEQVRSALDAAYKVYGEKTGGAALLGVYLEGPFLNPNRAGSQNIDKIQSALSDEMIHRYLDNPLIRVVVLAPEFPENMRLINECVRRGIVVSAGHTNAHYEDMLIAVERGVRQVTHCFNAMPPLNQRQPGVVGAALTMPELRCELICDNLHVHPVVQKILYQARGADGIILVSDSTQCAGLPDGEYTLDHRQVSLRNRSLRLPDGKLAGSVLTLNLALKNFMQAVNASLFEALPTVTLTPARALGIAHFKGAIEVGHDADLTLLDADMNVVWTIAGGEIVYQA
jgi:N-acetylglucosamine-6-phosphate deacetylase